MKGTLHELLEYLSPEEQAELDALLASEPPTLNQWLKKVTPDFNWDWPYQRYIQSRLEEVTSGKIKRLMLCVPPRHGKSQLATIRYPVFRLSQNPKLRVVVGAYNQDYADELSRDARRVAENPTSGITFCRDRNAVTNWQTVQGGGFRGVGVGGGITGRGADLIVIDDPVKSVQEAFSPTYRNRVYDWYKSDIYTRREPGAAIILIMTRWHEDDLAGRLLQDAKRTGEPWVVINLPALAEEGDALGREPGEALCPERFNAEELHHTRLQDERSFLALYQQRPRAPEGAMFKRDWFQTLPTLPTNLRFVRCWDLAVSTTNSADFSAGALVGIDSNQNIYIADMLHGRWEYPDLKRLILETAREDGPKVPVYVETVGFQKSVLQDLQREPEFLRIPLKESKADRTTGGKEVRALPWAAKAESGRLFLLEAAWNGSFIEEALDFPVGKHDDRIDAVSGAVNALSGTKQSRGIIGSDYW